MTKTWSYWLYFHWFMTLQWRNVTCKTQSKMSTFWNVWKVRWLLRCWRHFWFDTEGRCWIDDMSWVSGSAGNVGVFIAACGFDIVSFYRWRRAGTWNVWAIKILLLFLPFLATKFEGRVINSFWLNEFLVLKNIVLSSHYHKLRFQFFWIWDPPPKFTVHPTQFRSEGGYFAFSKIAQNRWIWTQITKNGADLRSWPQVVSVHPTRILSEGVSWATPYKPWTTLRKTL